jgi:hypothetical protein
VRRLLTPVEVSEAATAFLRRAADGGQPLPRLAVNSADVRDGVMRPAQLAYLSPDVSDMLVLNQIK